MRSQDVGINVAETVTPPRIVTKTIDRVVKEFHTIPGGKQAAQKHYTPNTPCFCLRDERWSWGLMAAALSWEFAKLRVNVSVSTPGLRWGSRSVESVFLCVNSGCGVDGGLLKSFR